MLEQGDLFSDEFGSLFSNVREIHVATQNMSKSGFFWNDKKEQILADCRAEIQKHEFQADYDRRNIQKLNGVIECLIEVKFIVLIKETNNIDEINNFFMNNFRNKIGIFVKLMRKVSMRWKN